MELSGDEGKGSTSDVSIRSWGTDSKHEVVEARKPAGEDAVIRRRLQANRKDASSDLNRMLGTHLATRRFEGDILLHSPDGNLHFEIGDVAARMGSCLIAAHLPMSELVINACTPTKGDLIMLSGGPHAHLLLISFFTPSGSSECISAS